jgi:hypothetical protein
MAKALTTGILAWVDLQKPKVVPTPIPPKKTTPNLKKRVILSPFR